MLLPSIALGPGQRPLGVPEAAWEQRAPCPLCALAGSGPALAPIPAAWSEMNTAMCSSPWLGPAAVELVEEPNLPLASSHCWPGT